MGPPLETSPLPLDLLEARDRGELILCVGPALGCDAGLPDKPALARALIVDAEAHALPVDAAALRTLVAVGRVEEALEQLERRMGARFTRVIEREFGERAHPVPALAAAIAALGARLRAVYTTGLDRLIERAFADAWPSFATAQGDLLRRRRLIVKLCGTLEFPETWALTQSSLDREWGPRALRRRLLTAAARAHCLLFVGFDPGDPLSRRLFAIVGADVDEQGPSHFVCVDRCDLEQRALLEARGLTPIVADPLSLLARLRGEDPSRSLEADGAELPACPYPGLRAFDRSLAPVFHGRRAEVSAAASRLGGPEGRHRRWLAIDGSSGVGKSSFVHAGLLPALQRGFAEGTPRRWRVASLRPGRSPLRTLAEALRASAAETSPPELAASADAIVDFVRGHGTVGAAWLLVVDQFEEIVTLAIADEREAFAACLTQLLEQQLIYLVTTLRSDFTAALSTAMPALARLLNDQAQRYTLAPISRVGLRAAIAEPAAQLGVRFEAELVERIAGDAEDHLGRGRCDEDGIVRTDDAALPLVAHVLRGLWEARAGDDGEVSFAEYTALGGVSGALSRSADALLAGLDDKQRGRARALLLRMVNLDGGRLTRRTLGHDEALILAGGPREGETLLQLLSGAAGPRLLVIRSEGAEVLVDLVHEALLREWDTLRGWIAADRAQLARDEALARRAAAWRDQGRSWRSLPRGPERRELLRGHAHGERAADQREYQRAMRSAAWLRGGAWIGFVGALAGIGYSSVLYSDTDDLFTLINNKYNSTKADIAKKQTEKANTQAKSANAKAQATSRQSELMELKRDEQCRDAAERILSDESQSLDAFIPEIANCKLFIGETARTKVLDPVTALGVSSGDPALWIGHSSGRLTRWTPDQATTRAFEALKEPISTIQSAPGGDLVAVAGLGHTRLLDDRGLPVGDEIQGREPIFAPTGDRLALHQQHRVLVYSAKDGTEQWSAEIRDGKVETKAFSAGGDALLVGVSTQHRSSIRSYRGDDQFDDSPPSVPGYLREIGVLPRQDTVVAVANWNLYTWSFGESPERLETPSLSHHINATKQFVHTSAQGDLILTPTDRDKIAVLDVNFRVLHDLAPVNIDIPPRLSPDERWLLAAGSASQVNLRAAGDGASVVTLDVGAPPSAITFIDEDEFAVGTEQGQVIRWSFDTHDHWRLPGGPVRLVVFMPGARGQLLFAGTADGLQRWAPGAPTSTQVRAERLMTLARIADRLVAVSSQGNLFAGVDTLEPRPPALCEPNHVAFDASGRLAVLCEDILQLWDATGLRDRKTVVGAELRSMALSPTGDRLALGWKSGAIELWTIDPNGALAEAPLQLSAHNQDVSALQFDPRGQFLISGGNDDQIMRWDLDDPTKPRWRKPAMSSENVESLAVTTDRIAVGGDAGTLTLWTPDGEALDGKPLRCATRVYALAFSDDGEALAAGCSDGVHVWPLGQAAQIDLICQRLAHTAAPGQDPPARCRLKNRP